MLIRAYGLFWSADEVEWYPGGGNKGRYMFLGRQGKQRPKLQLVDFRTQSGLYIPYGDYGPYYVGKADRFGRRLKQTPAIKKLETTSLSSAASREREVEGS